VTVWLLLLSLAGAVELSPGILVDRTIAVVDKKVITYSELLREARVALVIRQDVQTASSELSPELLHDYLNFLVDEVVIAAQARRVGGMDVSGEEVDRAAERFAARFPSVEAFRAFERRFDISETALKDILRRNLHNERYIAQRMKAWRATVEEGKPGADKEYQQALARWVGELRAGVELRLLSPSGELEVQ